MTLSIATAARQMRAFGARLRTRAGASDRSLDGRTIRPVTPDDTPAIAAMLVDLSTRSCRLRYSRQGFDAAGAAREAARLTRLAAAGGTVVVATVDAPGGERVVGIAELASSGDSAEAALVVADAHQNSGLGRRLVGALTAAAARQGLAEICFDTLEENIAMCSLVRQIPLPCREQHSCGEVRLVVTL